MVTGGLYTVVTGGLYTVVTGGLYTVVTGGLYTVVTSETGVVLPCLLSPPPARAGNRGYRN